MNKPIAYTSAFCQWILQSKLRTYGSFWLLLFVLYIPAWRAGFVSDFTGWLYDLQQSSFADHINRVHFKVESLYQFSQLVTWFFYQLFGTHHFLWHCLHLSLHALNVSLLYWLLVALFRLPVSGKIALYSAGILYCLAPSVSEVIVWEPSFHYLLGLLLFLGVMHAVLRYTYSQQYKWLLLAFVIYFLSSFSIELFYLTPVCAGLLLYVASVGDASVAKLSLPSLLQKTLPFALILVLHFVLVKLIYGHWLPHINAENFAQTAWTNTWSKPLKILINLLFLGRFYGQDTKALVYHWAGLPQVIIAFYGLCVLLFFTIGRYLKLYCAHAALPFFFITFCLVMMLGLCIPLWFSSDFWVVYDRYSYFLTGFLFAFLAMMAYWLLPRWLGIVLFVSFAGANVLALYKVNKKWADSAALTHDLMLSLPQHSDKKVLLLNMPQAMNGIFMMTANESNEVQVMRNLLYPEKEKYPLIDVCAYNMLTVKDGAHVQVLNDSTVRVMLNQWGTWWWYNDKGATNMEHQYFSKQMDEYGYNLLLKGKRDEYLLLYQVGREWKVVDWSKQNEDQY
ncbi:MAG: hypothetical protein IT256_08845 [Chitinophagaceae bacterium]|nr:hypothetical protein [Chitinophagaceae bacterium]